MITTSIIGGLGNQMFQYAAGRALALELGRQLRLDIAGFDHYGLHQGFELHRVFCRTAPLATPDAVRTLLGWRTAPAIRRALARPALGCLRGKRLVIEPHFHYWSGIRDVTAPAYLQGYWQSERYFFDAAATIRADFTFRQPLSEINAAWAERIDACEAVSLHVRRGDYVSVPRTSAEHGICTLNYYRAAVRYVSNRIEAPEFFIFSDDIQWARTHLDIAYPCHYVENNSGAESYNDMRLMSLCRHHIIANSSFSWWGAWLDPRPDKIVVAPSRWFASGNRCLDDLYPQGWTRL